MIEPANTYENRGIPIEEMCVYVHPRGTSEVVPTLSLQAISTMYRRMDNVTKCRKEIPNSIKPYSAA